MLAFGQYDNLEYAGIWAITLVMTLWGMTAALVAGVIAALTTYAVQSINYQNPIRQIMTASTLRSSAWARCVKSRAILENDTTGRARILVFQLQGHVRCTIVRFCDKQKVPPSSHPQNDAIVVRVSAIFWKRGAAYRHHQVRLDGEESCKQATDCRYCGLYLGGWNG